MEIKNVLSEETRNLLLRAVGSIINDVHEDRYSKGVLDTPERVARMYNELLCGYKMEVHDVVNNALFDVTYNEMVVVNNIDFYSLCEHHLIPFYGKAHVGYLPRDKVIGLSKIPRLVDMFARRLQVQERLTEQIADTIMNVISPHGVGIVIKAHHLCASMRGVKKPNVQMITSSMRGKFESSQATRDEFMSHVSQNSG